jgi:predicted RNA methylase
MNAPVQQYLDIEGAQLKRDLSQFFTPPDLAERLWLWAWHDRAPPHEARILEPSAGRGALVRAMLWRHFARAGHALAFDVDPENIAELHRLQESASGALEVRQADFLASPVVEGFDLAVMNPPFENDQDIMFLEQACLWCPRAVSIAPARIEHSEGRSEFWRWHDVRRKVILEKRPRFGGHTTGATDFVILELERRRHARLQGVPSAVLVERW